MKNILIIIPFGLLLVPVANATVYKIDYTYREASVYTVSKNLIPVDGQNPSTWLDPGDQVNPVTYLSVINDPASPPYIPPEEIPGTGYLDTDTGVITLNPINFGIVVTSGSYGYLNWSHRLDGEFSGLTWNYTCTLDESTNDMRCLEGPSRDVVAGSLLCEFQASPACTQNPATPRQLGSPQLAEFRMTPTPGMYAVPQTVQFSSLTTGGMGTYVWQWTKTPQQLSTIRMTIGEVAVVPVPAAAWLFGSALFGLVATRRKRLVSTICALASAIWLTGCSSGDHGGGETPTSSSYGNTIQAQGAAVKGPVKEAQAALYLLDVNASDLKGTRIASGTTTATGAFTGLVVPEAYRQEGGPYLIEVTGGREILTDTAPLIPTLRTIATADQLSSSNPVKVYATPLSTLALEFARLSVQEKNSDGDPSNDVVRFSSNTQVTGFIKEANDQQAVISDIFDLGILGNQINFFTSSPIVTADSDQEVVSKYRTVSESVAAMIIQVQAISGGNMDDVLSAIALDLFDGTADGLNNSVPIGELSAISDQDLAGILNMLPVDIMNLSIPGTNIPISNINTVLINEAAVTAPGTSVTASPQIITDSAIVGPDSDGDTRIDSLDAFPNDSTEIADTDSDGVGDVSDIFPDDPTKSSYCDSDDPDVLEENNCSNPQAKAGNDQERRVATSDQNRVFILNGSESYDPNDPDADLTYQWRVIEVPVDINGNDLVDKETLLNDTTSMMPSFTANYAGKYVFELIVFNGSQASQADSVTIDFKKDYYVNAGNLFGSAMIAFALWFIPARVRRLKNDNK